MGGGQHNIGLFPIYLNPPQRYRADGGGLAFKARHQTWHEEPDTGRPLSHYRQASLCHKHTHFFSFYSRMLHLQEVRKPKVA